MFRISKLKHNLNTLRFKSSETVTYGNRIILINLNIYKPLTMKKILTALLVIIVFVCQPSKAQESKDFRFTIKTNPLAALGGPIFITVLPITGEYKILFEARTAKKQSIEAGVSYLGPSLLLNLDEITDSTTSINTNGFRIQAAYKIFVTQTSAPNGFYVGPHFSYATATLKNKQDPADYIDATKINFNILIGYQLITPGGFTLNIYTGLGYKLRDYDIPNESDFDFEEIPRGAPSVPFGVSFGFAF
jgi:hypothetical protein